MTTHIIDELAHHLSCTYCDAEAFKPCVTRAGQVASQPHQDRLRIVQAAYRAGFVAGQATPYNRTDPVFPALCRTCGDEYTKPSDLLVTCSNAFHCCRDCKWQGGQKVVVCADHADIWGRE